MLPKIISSVAFKGTSIKFCLASCAIERTNVVLAVPFLPEIIKPPALGLISAISKAFLASS